MSDALETDDRRPPSNKMILCPYCGRLQPQAPRCVDCGGLFEPLSRDATQLAMGPWFIRDKAMPFRPGCSYEVIRKMAAAGRIHSRTILRGPTTRQFWSIARNVPGVAHLIGYCHDCGAAADPGDACCEACGAVFPEPGERNELGLQYPDRASADAGEEKLREKIEAAQTPAAAPSASTPPLDDEWLERVLDDDELDLSEPTGAIDFGPTDAASTAADGSPGLQAARGASLPSAVWVLLGLNGAALIVNVVLLMIARSL